MTSLSNLIKERIEDSQSTISAVSAFAEYVESRLSDLRSFVSGSGDVLSVPITYDATGQLVNKVVAVTQAQYASAIDGTADTLSVAINDLGDTISCSADTIVKAVEEQATELTVQSSFLDYCLEKGEINASEFLTRTRAIATTAPSEVLQKYASYIQLGGSPVDALRNLFSIITAKPSGTENTYISMVDPGDYTGNVWAAALTTVGNRIAGFFYSVVYAISHLNQALETLKTACISAVKWVAGTLFKQLLTVYDKASPAPAGIMDLPFIQVYWSTPDELKSAITTLANSHSSLYAINGYMQCRHTATDADRLQVICDSVTNLVTEHIDGEDYASVVEVIIPSDPFNVSLRLGRDENGRYCMSVYFCSDYATWSKYSDVELQKWMVWSFGRAFIQMSSVVPASIDSEGHYGGLTVIASNMYQFTSYNENTATDTGWVETLQCLGVSLPSLCSDMASHDQVVAFVISAILYMCLMSKGFVLATGSEQGTEYIDRTNGMIQGYITYDAAYVGDPEYLESISDYGANFDVSVLNSAVFRPYAKRKLLPSTIHYQTTKEQSDEILSAIAGVLIAVVVVIATVKFFKWKKDRRAATALAHGNADRLAWTAAENPTTANLEAFNKAFNKARKMDVINGILGVSTTDSNGLSLSVLQGLVQGVSKFSKNSDTSATSTISTINSTSSEVNNNVSSGILSVKKMLK